MIFYSFSFLAFFLTMSLLFQFSAKIRRQRWVILLANILFYGYWDARLLGLLFGIIGACYISAIAYHKTQRKTPIAVCVVFCLSVLAVCKYSNFFVEAFCRSFGIANRFSLQIILPLGISFYIFQALSYLFDVKKAVIPAQTDFVKLAAYLSFFPLITAGPIVKARDFLPQLDRLHRIKKENVYRGISLFLMGLTKKVVFADRIAVAVNAVYQAPGAYDGISILLALIGYAMQLYCDFSGYSDMAIGIAAIWDVDLDRNFNMPYLAKNSSDFWNRWHISLSSWFREYVYFPMGGSRCARWKTYRNLLITMLLSGLWHGANWTFLIWGGLHGVVAVVSKVWTDSGKTKTRHAWACILLNNVVVVLLWGLFRADSLQEVLQIYTGLFRLNGVHYINVFVVVYLVLMVLGNLAAYYRNEGNAIEINLNLDRFRNKLIISVWIFLIVMFAYVGDSAFIYAQF